MTICRMACVGPRCRHRGRSGRTSTRSDTTPRRSPPSPSVEKSILRLIDLLQGNVTNLHSAGIADNRIAGLTADSRQVQPGFLFAALAGSRNDGCAHIDEAVRRGAAAVLVRTGTIR